ncbi:hypothetical protein [Deinococcus roseus]|uniref:Uncharacterized protein n=1 Tax=Deinococcus roseus TaxID=392414 RepID=A0ABQ2CVQ7_9DEIO|nr:hypothetical protein [Deinococcus roseus]GGJ18964.1 hypothetical protein GCM10008938_01210 [Deinococcus roseus]
MFASSFKKTWIAVTTTLLLGSVALAQQDFPDWNVSQQGETWTLVPKKLGQNQSFKVVVFPVTALKNQTLQSWMNAFIQKDSAKRGQVISPLSDLEQQDQMLVGSMGIQAGDQQHILLYAGILAKEGHGQIFLMESSLDKTLSSTYGPTFSRLVAAALKEYHPEATSNAAFNLPAGAKLGGKLDYGTYSCQKPLDTGTTIKFSVRLYENGEYALGEDDTGEFKYDARNGKIDISVTHDLYNSSYDETEFSVYYRAKNNKPVIYAEEDYGLGVWKTTCLYAGKNTVPSPSQQEAEDRKKREEERRFKWVTAPGKGVQPSQMEGLFLHYELKVNPLNNMVMQMPELALVLKDGTAYTGLRVPPEDLDIQASRKNEPKNWTRWKKNGKNILLQEGQKWNDIGSFKVVPAQKNEKLQDSFKNIASSYQAGLGGTTWTTYYLFDGKGKFEISNSTLSSTGIIQANNGFSSSASSTSDKDGTQSTVGTAGGGDGMGGGPAAVVTTQNQSKQGNPEKAGTYTLNGYTLQLKLGNGKVVRKLFFFFDSKKEDVWIEDTLYNTTRKD